MTDEELDMLTNEQLENANKLEEDLINDFILLVADARKQYVLTKIKEPTHIMLSRYMKDTLLERHLLMFNKKCQKKILKEKQTLLGMEITVNDDFMTTQFMIYSSY